MKWIWDFFISNSNSKKEYPIPPRPPTPAPRANTPRPACIACMLRHEQEKSKGETL